jgi:hypothetical protein
MNLLCGTNFLEQNNDTLNQFEEGKRAHTIKFMFNPIKVTTKSNPLNGNNQAKNKQKYLLSKNTVNASLNKGILLKKPTLNESNKFSNNTSELEIIEYPMNDMKKNDINNFNDIIAAKAKDYINDKSQNNILDYFKDKQGFNYLNLFLENDNINNNNSNYGINDKDNNTSSKSDEIICSYIEIDNKKHKIFDGISKEKRELKKQNPFIQIHQSKLNHYSLLLNNINNKNNHKNGKVKLKPSNNTKSKSKDKSKEKKVNAIKITKKNKIDMKFRNLVDYNNKTMVFKKNKILNEDIEKNSFFESNNHSKVHINKFKKNRMIKDSKTPMGTFRSIESSNNINPINKNNKIIKNKIETKNIGNSQINQPERSTFYDYQIYKKIKGINSRDKNNNHNYSHITQMYKSIQYSSSNNKNKKINSKGKIVKNNCPNPMFFAINIRKKRKVNKGTFLSLTKSFLNTTNGLDPKTEIKTENNSKDNSRLKLRKMLINNPNNKKHKYDLSFFNFNHISNNSKLIIRKNKNKAIQKIHKTMNESETNKKFNDSIQIKNGGDEKLSIRNLFLKKLIK